MKTMFKTFGYIVLAMVIGFSMTACDELDRVGRTNLTGMVSFSSSTPKVGETIIAIYNPGNGTGLATWQWFRLTNLGDITLSSTGNSYIPVVDDVGFLLRATVSYADQNGSISATTIYPVAPAGSTDPGTDPECECETEDCICDEDCECCDECNPNICTHAGEWTIKIAATCLAEGEEERICTLCDFISTRSINIDSNAHNWGNWILEIPPTAIERGMEGRTCQRIDCLHYESRIIPPISTNKMVVINQNTTIMAGTTANNADLTIADADALNWFTIVNVEPNSTLSVGTGEWDTLKGATAVYFDKPLSYSEGSKISAVVSINYIYPASGNTGFIIGFMSKPALDRTPFAHHVGLRIQRNMSRMMIITRGAPNATTNSDIFSATNFSAPDVNYNESFIYEVFREPNSHIYNIVIKNMDGTIIASGQRGQASDKNGLVGELDGDQPIYAGFIVSNATVQISDIKITEGTQTIFSTPAPAPKTAPISTEKMIIINQNESPSAGTTANNDNLTISNADDQNWLTIANAESPTAMGGASLALMQGVTVVYFDKPLLYTAGSKISAVVRMTSQGTLNDGGDPANRGVIIGFISKPDSNRLPFVQYVGNRVSQNLSRRMVVTGNNNFTSTDFNPVAPSVALNESFIYEVYREPNNPVYNIVIKNMEGTIITSGTRNSGVSELGEGQPVYAGFVVSGVTVQISDIKITEGTKTLYSTAVQKNYSWNAGTAVNLITDTPTEVNGHNWIRKSGNIQVTEAGIVFPVSGDSRLTIGTADISNSTSSSVPIGEFDLSQGAKLTITFTNAPSVWTELFQVSVNNNTISVYNSPVPNNRRFSQRLDQTSGTIEIFIVPSALGEHESLKNAFIMLRKESALAGITITSILLEEL